MLFLSLTCFVSFDPVSSSLVQVVQQASVPEGILVVKVEFSSA